MDVFCCVSGSFLFDATALTATLFQDGHARVRQSGKRGEDVRQASRPPDRSGPCGNAVQVTV